MLANISRGRAWLPVFLAGFIGIVASLMLGQLVLVRFSDARLDEYAGNLMTYSVNVAQTSRSTLATMSASDEPICSDKDLVALRLLSFKTQFLRDVGRVQDGSIICTALWGPLAHPVKLPQPHRKQGDGDLLWENAENIGEHQLKVDMVVRRSAIVFTSPVAFKVYQKPEDGLSALVLTHDGQYIYRSFGNTEHLKARLFRPASWYDSSPNRVSSRCSGEVDICVVASLAGINILGQPALTLLGIGSLGALTGGSIGVAALLYSRGRSSLPQQIRRAVADGRLEVVYQPLVCMRNGSLVGAEALARLSDDSGEPISPDVFIKIAEEIGLIGRITRIVIHKALLDMQSRLAAGSDFHLGINLCVSDILDPTLRGYLDEEVMRLGVSPQRVVLEITERSTTDHGRLIESMEALRKGGYEFFIDDFGTGYSSFAYLARLPIHGIKIDRMFTQAIGKEAVSSAIVENICSIADKLGAMLVVEGVETSEQAAYILALHPDAIGQGWLYGKPTSPDGLVASAHLTTEPSTTLAD